MAFTAWTKIPSDFLKYELAADYCRDTVQLASGENLARGTVLGLTLQSGATVTGAADAANTGDGTIGTLSAGAAAQIGVYRAVFISTATDLGNFLVFDPNGLNIGQGIVGTEFAGEVVFTIADGATDFAEGDAFDITVVGTIEAETLDLAATDRTNIAAAILLEAVDASAAAANAAVLRRGPAIVADVELVYPSGATAAQKTVIRAQLAALGIKVQEAA